MVKRSRGEKYQWVRIWTFGGLPSHNEQPFLSSTITSSNNARKWRANWLERMIERKIILYLSEALKHVELFNLVHMGNKMEKLVDDNLVASHFIVLSVFLQSIWYVFLFLNPWWCSLYKWNEPLGDYRDIVSTTCQKLAEQLPWVMMGN